MSRASGHNLIQAVAVERLASRSTASRLFTKSHEIHCCLAHIGMDADEQLGQPIVSNGLPLTKLHHAAFDAHLIGIDPDFRIHVSERLLEIHDGPFLGLGLKGIVGQVIQLPRRREDRPDRKAPWHRPQRLSSGRWCSFGRAYRNARQKALKSISCTVCG